MLAWSKRRRNAHDARATRCPGGRSPETVNSSSADGAKTAEPTASSRVGDSTISTMPAASASGAVAGVHPAAQLRLDLGELLARRCSAERSVAGGGGDEAVGCGGSSAATVRDADPTTRPRPVPSSRLARPVADWKRGLRRVLYPAYEARVVRRLPADRLPQARRGDARRQPALGQGRRRGHRRTATAPAPPTSSRCSAGATSSASRSSPCGCSRPTTSTGPPAELEPLLAIIEDVVDRPRRRAALAAAPGRRARPAARRDRASGSRRPPRRPATSTACMVNIAVGYGGRREIADAVRSLLQEHAVAGHARSRSSPRSSTSSTSPSTSTPRASPTPTW